MSATKALMSISITTVSGEKISSTLIITIRETTILINGVPAAK